MRAQQPPHRRIPRLVPLSVLVAFLVFAWPATAAYGSASRPDQRVDLSRFAAPATRSKSTNQRGQHNRLLVTAVPGTAIVGGTELTGDGSIVEIQVPAADEAAISDAIAADGDVISIEPDTLMYFSANNGVTNDPLASKEWALDRIGWRTAPFFPSLGTIAFLDSGLSLGHEEIAGNLSDGRPKVSHTWNTINDDPTVADSYGHGTATASVAAALTNNGQGIASIAPGAQIMMVKIGGSSGLYTSDAIQGLNWAVSHGARVVNMSFSTPLPSTAFRNAILKAADRGVTLVASAGNEGCLAEGDGNPLGYPAGYPHVIGVSASTPEDDIACFSNFGPEVDLAAPGTLIPAAVPVATARAGTLAASTGYRTLQGTSFSAPIVAGAVASIQNAHPTWNGDQIRKLLQSTAKDIAAAGYDHHAGAGLLNLDAAMASTTEVVQDTTEVNDEVFVAKTQAPILLAGTTSIRRTLNGTVEASHDPRDVYHTYLRTGQVIRVAASRTAGKAVGISIYRPSTPSMYASSTTLSKYRVARSRDGSTSPYVEFRAKVAGRYLINVSARSGRSSYFMSVRRSWS